MDLIAKTLFGLENVLAGELNSLGAKDVKTVNRAVVFRGEKDLLYSANYCCRTALSVLMKVTEFRIRSKDDLYRKALTTDWGRYLDPEMTFSISPVVNSAHFDHSGYAGLVLKDAIADHFRTKTGKRPSVSTADPAILINLHISHDLVTISIDSSVIPLFKRGYRIEQSVAPLNEVLAAGIILLSGWNGATSFTDPMCGSGTIPIEAALIATGTAPGKFRKFFGFQRWKDYDEELFTSIRKRAEAAISAPLASISGSDISEKAVHQSMANVRQAGLDSHIRLKVSDFKDLKGSEEGGILVMNPPYGLRLNPEELDSLYGMIGSTLKHGFTGYTAWVITSNMESLKHVGLKPKEKHALYNGALECTLLKYELYQGSRKR